VHERSKFNRLLFKSFASRKPNEGLLEVDARAARRTAVLSHGAFALPYLPDRQERKVFTHLIGRRAVALTTTSPNRVPAFADHRLPACLRKLPRLRVGPHQGR